ncbi:MAG TPA: non-ribosomal peptide synthetase, partial [Kofleriaceae bacterium]|nr:non-ribosomal peptide synthetase [Kofleriaceae bacterium]
RQLAHRLIERGARRDQPIAVAMEKGPEQIIAVLGILAAGAPYLPVDVEAPPGRIRGILERARVELVLAQPALAARLELPAGVACHAVDDAWLDGAPEAPPRAIDPGSLAYVLYTSGSTGQPRGVMIEHRGLISCLADTGRRFEIGPDDRVLAVTALHHDMSVFDVLGVLAAGGAVVLPSADRWRDPAHWAALMREHRVTLWNSVPAFMSMLLEHARAHPGAIPPGLRWAFLGGDWIPLSVPQDLREHRPEARVVSVGGPTETTLWNICYVVDAVEPGWRSIPYGRPMANTRYHVLSPRLERCPVWVAGEMCVEGVGLGRGYLDDEDQTRQRFFVHPRTGARMYRTGDLGRVLPDGNLEILGREDFQVKVRGHRVELAEVEAALAAHPGVRAAAVVAVGERGNQRLAGFVTGDDLDLAEVRATVARRLPPYMIPELRSLGELPRTGNGKVDRRRLIAQASGAPAERSAPALPGPGRSDAITNDVVQVVRDVLELGELGPDADLASLGATSVDFIRIANGLEARFGVRLPIERLFTDPSIAGMAQFYGHRPEPGSAVAALLEQIERLSDEEAARLAASLAEHGASLRRASDGSSNPF